MKNTKFYKNDKLDPTIMLYKFIIPQSESINMYNYIYKMGYGAASLFPGYDGVVKEIHDNKMLHEVMQHQNK